MNKTVMRRYALLALPVMLEMLTLVFGASYVFAATLDDIAPTQGNSTPNGGHVFMIRKAGGMGVQPDVRIASYTKADPASGTFSLKPGTTANSSFVCDKPSSTSGFPPDRYISVTVGDADGSPKETSYISYDKACAENQGRTNAWNTNLNNVFYANYNIPNGTYDKDLETGLYKVVVEVKYDAGVPNGGTAPNLVQQRFRLNMSMNGAKVGPYAQNRLAFPVVGDWDRAVNYPNTPQDIKVPFGLPCSNTSGGNRSVGIYDADNGVFPYRVKFFIQRYDLSSSSWVNVPFLAGTIVGGGSFSGKYFIPGDRPANQATYQGASISMLPQTRYQMVIEDIVPRNTIDIEVPGDTIFGAIDCGWSIDPTSKVYPSTQVPGGTVTFTHTSTNTGSYVSTNVTSTAYWGKTGQKTSGTLSNDTRVYQASGDIGDSADFPNTFTIPAGATSGQQFCQYLRVNPRQSGESPAQNRDSVPACVTVSATPPPADRTVTITPVVQDGADIEPTETTMLNGSVFVSGFPSDPTEYGYKQYSMRADATREPVIQYGALETDGPETIPATANTTYYCDHPNDYNRVGSTCYHHYVADDTKAKCQADGHLWNSSLGSGCRDTHPAKSNTTYSCPSTYIQSGTSCSRVRYRCNDYPSSGSWGSWNASPPSCPPKYRCASGAGLDWSTNPPKCKAWTCPYAPSTYIYSSTKPLCEYRCDSGTGAVAYPFTSDPGYSSPCYRQPSFTLVCRWDSGSGPISEIVRGNGQYCVSSVPRVGTTIGTYVCASLTTDYPTGGAWGWTPDWAPPGYKVDPDPPGNGINPRQQTQWGFTMPPASDTGCSRVVAKPTVKVLGGDVAVGTKFADACTLGGLSSSIMAWPHSPDYNASYTQYAAYAPGQIYGFATGALRAPDTQPPRSLAFANTIGSGTQYGGGFGPMPCVADHAIARPPTATSIGSLMQPGLDGSYDYNSPNINNSRVIEPGQQIVLYHTGDLYINTNIFYNRTAPWTKPADIPALKIVVKGGNIYIDPSVTQLNGVFVVQPDAGVGGHIYTCGTVSDNNLFSGCRTRLTVNGAFIAKQVHLGRTNSMDPMSTAIFGGTSEQFNYLPEVWLAEWPVDTTTTVIKYDAITNLPPIL